jgi:hypothetical protein
MLVTIETRDAFDDAVAFAMDCISTADLRA